MILEGKFGIPEKEIRSLCEDFRIRRFSIFVSTLHDSMKADIDLLVEFEPGHVPGLRALAKIQNAFSELLGHPVDLQPPNDLSLLFREAVLHEAQAQYASS